MKFGSAALVDLNELHRQWYDWTMKNGPRPDFLKDRVAYYLLAEGNSGANGEWKYAKDFAQLTSTRKSLYLDASVTGGHGLFQSGSLREEPSTSGADEFIYDPLDLKRGELEATIDNEKNANIDQRLASSIGQDGQVYHSEPMKEGWPWWAVPR